MMKTDTQPELKRMYELIDQNRGLYLEWLFDLCRSESVSAQGRAIRETAEAVCARLQENGAEARLIETEGNPVVFGEWQTNGARTLSFYNHYDVQPEDPLELWDHPPFDPEVRDGKIYARGVADNKGTLMARICAVHAYRQIFGELPLHLKFIVEGEEEVGSPSLPGFAETHQELIHADANIWENGFKDIQGNLQVSLGCKGMLYVELHAKGAKTWSKRRRKSLISSALTGILMG